MSRTEKAVVRAAMQWFDDRYNSGEPKYVPAMKLWDDLKRACARHAAASGREGER